MRDPVASTRGYDPLTKKPFYAKIGVSWAWYVDSEAVHGESEVVRAEPFPEAELRLAEWW